jgi:hypothetical protein
VTGDRDRQRNRVYVWEERLAPPCDPTSIEFTKAQAAVDAIWAEMGRRFPPKVERLPRQARSTVTDAARLLIRLLKACPSSWLPHELVYAITSTHNGQADGLGSVLMGPYVQLLIRYARLPRDTLLQSLTAVGIGIEVLVTPVFVDV